jgi:hypothetical protein
MIVVKGTDDGKWGLYLDGVLLGDSKHRYEADHAKQILLRYLQKHGGEIQTDDVHVALSL